MTERTIRVLHLAAYLRRIGGVASVVRTYKGASVPGRVAFTARSTVDGRIGLPMDLATVRAATAVLHGRRRHDVVHVHVTQRGSLVREGLLIRLGRAAGVPVVVTVHGSSFAAFAAGHPRLTAWALSPAAEVLCLTASAAAAVTGLSGAPRVSVVDNPVGEHPVRATSARPTALFLGEVGLRKGVDRLAHAWQQVCEAVPDARLEIAGPVVADGRDDLRHLLGMPGVTYHGEVGPSRVGELIDMAWLTVLPSRAEALPRAILETMAAGRAVVAADVGEVRSVVDDDTGVLMSDPRQLGDSLVALLADADMVRRLGAAGRRRVAVRHALPDHLRRLAEVYERATVSGRQGKDHG